jgi:hypothetical protein
VQAALTEERSSFPDLNLDGLVTQRTDHFIAYSVPEASQGMQNTLADAEEQRENLFAKLNLQTEKPIRVFFLPNLNDYFDRKGVAPRAPAWAIGLAIPSDDTILIKWGRNETGQWVDLERTFIHELAHMGLDFAVGEKGIHIDGSEERAAHHKGGVRRIPRWLHEGFAIHSAGEWSLERSTVLMQAGLRGRIIPLAKLQRSFPADGFDVSLAYAESYHFVMSLFEKHGDGALAPLLRELQKTDNFEVAYARAYGDSFVRDEAAWRQRLNIAYTWVPLITGSSAVWFLGGMVFFMAWRRKRKERREGFAKMEAEEAVDIHDRVPLPGLGLTTEDAAPKPWRVLHDGTAVPNDEWGLSLGWPESPSRDIEEAEVPKTQDGHTLH